MNVFQTSWVLNRSNLLEIVSEVSPLENTAHGLKEVHLLPLSFYWIETILKNLTSVARFSFRFHHIMILAYPT